MSLWARFKAGRAEKGTGSREEENGPQHKEQLVGWDYENFGEDMEMGQKASQREKVQKERQK